MKAFWDWLDHRTGLAQVLHEALYERIPGGARWRYVWGSTLVFAFFTQLVTGTFLWMSYSPSAQSAWESVYFIQYEMQGGWLLRGVHHFMAQAMVVLLALHFLQVVVDGAYRAPREVNFWIGLILLQIVFALSLTGYLLPWDQKGYWATQVATKLMGVVPGVGTALQRLVVGGTQYGHHTLTRFFALHAGVLPGLLILFLAVHLYLFRRHGIHVRPTVQQTDAYFWPDQVLRDAVACLAVLLVVLMLVVRPALAGAHALGVAPGDTLGAELGAPADPSTAYAAARPEWYFLFLFQFLKLFHGETQEFVGAVLVPSGILGLIFLMPLVGRWRVGHLFNVGLLGVLLLAIGALTTAAVQEDRRDPAYQRAVREAEEQARRARELALGAGGIPATGAITLLREDAKTQGPWLFRRHCASCHPHAGVVEDQTTASVEAPAEGPAATAPAPSAPDLSQFASREWLAGLLDPERVAGTEYFGRTAHAEGDMAHWVKERVPALDEAGRADLQAAIVALSAEAALPRQRALDRQDSEQVVRGQEAIRDRLGCTECHRFHDAGELGVAPDLTGYGSTEWIVRFLSNPEAEACYGEKNDRMPAFAVYPDDPDRNRLAGLELRLLSDWLRQDWYEPEQVSTDAGKAESPEAAEQAK